MANIDLRQLAQLTASKKKVDAKLAKFILNRLSRKELIEYAHHLRTIADKNSVKILSQNPIDSKLKNSIVKRYPDKEVVFIREDVGDGIKVVINDTIIDLTLTGITQTTVEKLKETN